MTLWSYDVEAEDWDKVKCVVFVSDEGDVERFKGPGAIERAADHMDNVKGTHVAHAGGIYDTLLITQARQRPWSEVVMSGSAVLCASERSLKVRDSFRWWLAGLRKVGQFLDGQDTRRRAALDAWKALQKNAGALSPELELMCKTNGIDVHELRVSTTAPEAPHGPPGAFLKKDVDRNRISELTEEETLAYCESDCVILLEGVKEAHRYLEEHGARRAWTAGSSALAMLQALEPASWGLLRSHALDLDDAIGASQCVRGARVETWALGRVDGVYCYDVKSSYPTRYAHKPIPIGARRLEESELRYPPAGSVIRCRWFWPWRGGETNIDARARIPPVLDQVTGAGAGWCEAWCIDEEIEALEDFVGVQRIEGWAPELMAPIGQIFVRELYEQKELGSFFAKVFLNSFHGKTSESPIRECWLSGGKPTDYYGPEPTLIGDYWRFLDVAVDKNGRCPPHLQPLAAAYILGRARIALWRDVIIPLLAAGWAVYYVDTDSVHTNCPPEKMPIRLGSKLGMLAPEGGPFTCFYSGPKAYCACDPTTGEVKKGALKGVPWNDLKDGVRERSSLYGNLYRRAEKKERGEDLRRAVFEEALRELDGAKVKKEGIATWAQGLRKKDGWTRYSVIRTIAPHERGKTFDRKAGPTVYAYRSPAELLAGRRLELSRDPFDLARNPAGDDPEPDFTDDELFPTDGPFAIH